MKKVALMDKPKICLDLEQTEEIVRHEMMWHLSHPDGTEDKILKAFKRVLKYYSTEEQYKDFMNGRGDWREVAQ